MQEMIIFYWNYSCNYKVYEQPVFLAERMVERL